MVVSTQNAEHYNWGNNCDGWHLLKSGSLSVIQEMMPVGSSEALHFHSKSQQVFFILSGIASFTIDGEIFKVHPNESIHVLPGKVHFISNNGDEELKFLVISEPMSHGDRVEGLK
jgi:mannose-6-phosphate isomerase-like protein (cupin superfamily)